MTSTISHEMRNPLNSIVNQCNIQDFNIKEVDKLYNDEIRFNLDAHLQQKFDQLLHEFKQNNVIQVTASNLLIFHVEDILGLAALKTGKFTKKITQFDLKKALSEIQKIQEYNATTKEVRVTLSLFGFPMQLKPEDLSGFEPNRPNFNIMTDKMRLQQIFVNIYSNAIKFTEKGGRVDVRASLIKGEKINNRKK